MRMRLLLGVVAIVLASGVADIASASRTTGELRIRERDVDTGSFYFEGAYQYVTVRRTRDHRILYSRRSQNRLSARLSLSPGYYRVDSWTRSCAGTCATLDRPSDRCRGFFRVRADRYVTATIHSGVGIRCHISNP